MSGTGPAAEEGYFAASAVHSTLGRSSDVDACVALARKMAELIGQALAFFKDAQSEMACQAGCHFCCHLRVMVYPHEAIALHRYLGSTLPADKAELVRERLIENAAQLRKSQQAFAALQRSPCAFLLEGQCSVYEVRPAACAAYHSLSRASCEADYQAGSSAANLTSKGAAASGGIPVSEAMRQVGAAMSQGLESALNTLGLPATQVELQTAVAALLQEPALIGRWRNGREWPRDARGVVAAKK